MTRLILALSVAPLLTACPKTRATPLTGDEAREALEESAVASQAEALTAATVDIATRFTIGDGITRAADELSAFVTNQLPCAEVTLEESTLTVEYGAREGDCTYRGHQLTGTTRITVAHNDAREVRVDHEWIDLSNGRVSLDGNATVTWNLDQQTRRIVHDTRWTSLTTGRSVDGEGDRVQSVLTGGALEGIRIDGSRSWRGQRGAWYLSIDGVEMRWADPVPQSGSYVLSTPFDKSMGMSFARVDEDTIRVKVSSGGEDRRREFAFTVSKLGAVEPD